jgi:hypothetical protein
MAETVIDTFWWQQPSLPDYKWEVRCYQGDGERHRHVLGYFVDATGFHLDNPTDFIWVASINMDNMTIKSTAKLPTTIMERFLSSIQTHTEFKAKGLPPKLTEWDRLTRGRGAIDVFAEVDSKCPCIV